MYKILSSDGENGFQKETLLKVLTEINDGIIPSAALSDNISSIWDNMTANNPSKGISAKKFDSFFTKLDILQLATIIM